METPATPPKSALRFLRWFCREEYADEIEGNLVELFDKQVQHDASGARRRFIVNVLLHFRPEYLKALHRQNKTSFIRTAMIANYLKIAFRNIRKKASFSFINIFGLALGVSACLLILNYIDFETSYDNFHVNAPNVYRVNRTFIQNDEPHQPTIKTTFALGPKLAQDISGIKRYIRIHDERTVVSYERSGQLINSFHEDHVLIADSTFFHAFTFNSLTGNLSAALNDPNSIVLTETARQRYFGNEDAIGKALQLSGGRMDGLYTVTAVIEDVPQNSHLSFNMVVPMHNIFSSKQYQDEDGWAWNNFNTYVELNDRSDFSSVAEKLPDFCKRWMDPKWEYMKGRVELRLQPLLSIHTEPGLRHNSETISRSTIYFFGLIAVFILVIAWINYINLSTARAMERSREVGIKKAIGALRRELITQFMFESLVINMIAIVLAVVFALLLLPALGDMIGKHLSFNFADSRLWLALSVLFSFGTLASGIYPAFVLSSFSITNAIKNRLPGHHKFSLRQGLVVFQFVASLVLIAGTFLVYRQICYMQSQNTGLQMEQMLIVRGPGTLTWEVAMQRAEVFKHEARKFGGVEAVATSGAVPGGEHNWGADTRKIGAPATDDRLASVVYVDPDFIPTYKISIISGRNYNPEIASDMKSAVINEAAVNAFKLGTPEEAQGQQILLGNDTVSILGVVKNFNWTSLKSDFTPFILMPESVVPVDISVHLKGGSIPSSVEAISKLYKDLLPGEPFEYRFLDDSFNALYKSDQQFGNIFGMFSGLAIGICCLGLWGLASFTTSQKLKEIGIRKVLGASIGSIAMLLIGQFLVLIGISAVVALPLGWYGMNTWLSGFAFRIGVEWDLFVIPVLILTSIALLTIGLQVRRGATMNPVDVLKSE